MIRFASAQAQEDLPPLPHGDTFTYPLDGEVGRVVGLRSDGAGGFVPIARVTVTFKASLADADADALAQRHATEANGYLTENGAASGVAEFNPIIVPASVMADFPATSGVPDTVWYDVQAEDADGIVRTVYVGQFTPSGQVTAGQLYGVPADFEFSPESLTLASVSDSDTVTVTVVDALGNAVGAGHIVTATSSSVLIATTDAATYLTNGLGQVTVVITRTGTGIVAVVFDCEAASGEIGGASISASLTATVPAPTLTATATLTAPGAITGSLSATVPAPTLTATATVTAPGGGIAAEIADLPARLSWYVSTTDTATVNLSGTDVVTWDPSVGAGAFDFTGHMPAWNATDGLIQFANGKWGATPGQFDLSAGFTVFGFGILPSSVYDLYMKSATVDYGIQTNQGTPTTIRLRAPAINTGVQTDAAVRRAVLFGYDPNGLGAGVGAFFIEVYGKPRVFGGSTSANPDTAAKLVLNDLAGDGALALGAAKWSAIGFLPGAPQAGDSATVAAAGATHHGTVNA